MGWVARARSVAAASAVVVAVVPAHASASTPQSPTPPPASGETGGSGGTSNTIALRLDDQGVLHAEETISFGDTPPGDFTRTFVTREAYDSDHDRLYEVSAVRAATPDGADIPVHADEGDATLTARLETAGRSTAVLRYTVRGTTDRVGSGVELDWTAVGGYSAPVAETTVTVDAGTPPAALSCTAGEPRSSIYCTSSDMGGHQALVARFLQADMGVGQRLDTVVNYPAGTAPGEPILERNWSLTSAFVVTPATAGIFGLLLLVLVGGLVALIRLRGRDERSLRTEAQAGDSAPVIPGDADRDTVRFRPPDDVHPGQIGTLIDEQADVVDITATVVDLAVRGYLTIRELPHEHFTSVDWQLERREEPTGDEALPYERILLDALFHRRDRVRLSELGSSGFPARLSAVRDELYRDMVLLGWFSRRPNVERNRWTTAGIALTAGGVLLTGVLALFTQAAFTGLAVIIAGAAVTLGAHYMPAKTRQGSVVFAHTLGFRAYLASAEAEDTPVGSRVELFSRYLPYAVIFDDLDRWADALASAAADGLHWYAGPEEWRMADFADSVKAFTLTLTGVVSNTRQFRALT